MKKVIVESESILSNTLREFLNGKEDMVRWASVRCSGACSPLNLLRTTFLTNFSMEFLNSSLGRVGSIFSISLGMGRNSSTGFYLIFQQQKSPLLKQISQIQLHSIYFEFIPIYRKFTKIDQLNEAMELRWVGSKSSFVYFTNIHFAVILA